MCLEFPEFPCLSTRDRFQDRRSEETCAGFKCLGVITSLALSVLSAAGFFQTGDPFFTVLTGVFSLITACLLVPWCCADRTNHVGVSISPPLPLVRRQMPSLVVDIPQVVSPPVYHIHSQQGAPSAPFLGQESLSVHYLAPPPAPEPVSRYPESHVRVGDRRQPEIPFFPQQPVHQPSPLQERVQVGDQRQPGLERVFDLERRVPVGKKN